MKIILLEKSQVSYPKHNFPWHVHPDHYTLSYVTSGQALLEFAQQKMTISPGDLIFVPAGLVHRTQILNSFAYELIRFRFTHSIAYLPSYPFAHFTCKTQIQQFREWFNALNTAHNGQHSFNIEQLPLFFQQFLTKNYQGEPIVDPAILRCLSYLHRHYDSNVRISDLGKISLRSTSHLQRTFKQQLGISPVRYLLALKVDKAKELMRQDISLSRIAQAAGFFDQSHFNRYFKQFAGLSPMNYRRILVE